MLQERHDFVCSYKERRGAVRAKANGAANAAAKALSSKANVKWRCEVSHEAAKRLIPKGSTIWRGLTKRVWCGQYGEYKRVSAPWGGPGGQQAGLTNVVRRLWNLHIEHHGLQLDVAPEGLFEQDEGVSQAVT